MFVHGAYDSFDHDVGLPRSGRGAAVAGLRVCSLAQSMWKSECRNEFSPWRWGYKKRVLWEVSGVQIQAVP